MQNTKRQPPAVLESEEHDVSALVQHAATVGHRERLAFRPTSDQKALYERAASLQGQTLSEFIRQAVEERAKSVIAEHERIVLTDRAREKFLAALVNPPKPTDKLAALAERYAREVESRS